MVMAKSIKPKQPANNLQVFLFVSYFSLLCSISHQSMGNLIRQNVTVCLCQNNCFLTYVAEISRISVKADGI